MGEAKTDILRKGLVSLGLAIVRRLVELHGVFSPTMEWILREKMRFVNVDVANVLVWREL